jgi:pyruvate/2-oxoglutarate dehydrogenase complex dihydrolipoamide acyltransferase (E2) component
MTTHADFQTRSYSAWRIIMSDALRVASEKNYVYGLYAIDVTDARRCIHDFKARTGGDFSFTAFLVGCIALAVDENKSVQALRQGKRLVIFDDVDVNIPVEHDLAGEKVMSSHIVRAANRKTAHQIHDEIRAVQHEPISAAAPLASLPRWTRLATRLPGFIRRLILRRMLANPFSIRQLGGTINLTTIGMAATGGGWGIAIGEMSLNVVVGGIEHTPKVIEGQIVAREILSLTLSFDHDVIDGAPAARFAARLKALIEAAHGLEPQPVSGKG